VVRLPLRQLPGKQRMLRFGVADEVSILLPVVVLPLGEQLIAMAVAQFVQKLLAPCSIVRSRNGFIRILMGRPVKGSWSSERASTGP